MSEGRKIYDGKGKLLGTFRPAKGDDSSGGGCLGIIVALLVFIYLIMEGWSGIVKPTYHFAPVDSVGTELLVRSMTFEKGRFRATSLQVARMTTPCVLPVLGKMSCI